MKNHIYLILTLVFFYTKVSAQNFTIKGRIEKNDSLMIMFGDGIKIDTLFTKTGYFNFKRDLVYPELLTLVLIKPGTKDYAKRDFFVGSGEVIVNSDFLGLASAEIKISDPNAQNKYNEFRKRFNPLVKVARHLIDSSYVSDKTEKEKTVYRELYNRVLEIEKEVSEAFVLENTDNVVGAFVLSRYLRIDNYTKLDSLYRLFNPDLYASGYLINIKQKLGALSTMKEGILFPPFSIITNDGKTLELTELKGKYVVLDFWGTWCPPCIKGIPKMKEYYNKYKDRAEFIGIACNEEPVDWLNTIEKYKLNWPQTLNESKENDLAAQYNIESYPTKIIIDPNGILVQSFKSETGDFYKKLDILLKEN